MSPFTNWDEVPLVCGVEDAAKVLNLGASTLYRQLERNEYVPGLMPRAGREPWRFSKAKLRDYIDGGYQRRTR